MSITITKTNAEHSDIMIAFNNKIYSQISTATSTEEIYQLAEAYRALGPYGR